MFFSCQINNFQVQVQVRVQVLKAGFVPCPGVKLMAPYLTTKDWEYCWWFSLHGLSLYTEKLNTWYICNRIWLSSQFTSLQNTESLRSWYIRFFINSKTRDNKKKYNSSGFSFPTGIFSAWGSFIAPYHMTTAFRITGPVVHDIYISFFFVILNNKPLWGESTGHRRWIPLTKASDTERWCFLWSAAQQTAEQTIEMPRIWDAIAPITTASGILWVHVTGGNFHRFSNVADRQMPAVRAVQGAYEWVYILMRTAILLLAMGEMRSSLVVKKNKMNVLKFHENHDFLVWILGTISQTFHVHVTQIS